MQSPKNSFVLLKRNPLVRYEKRTYIYGRSWQMAIDPITVYSMHPYHMDVTAPSRAPTRPEAPGRQGDLEPLSMSRTGRDTIARETATADQDTISTRYCALTMLQMPLGHYMNMIRVRYTRYVTKGRGVIEYCLTSVMRKPDIMKYFALVRVNCLNRFFHVFYISIILHTETCEYCNVIYFTHYMVFHLFH